MQTLFYHQFYHLAVRFSKIPHPDNTYRTHKLLQNNLLCFVALQIIVWQNPGLCDDLASALQPVDSVTLPDSVTAIDVSNHLLPDNRYVQVSSAIYTKKQVIIAMSNNKRYVQVSNAIDDIKNLLLTSSRQVNVIIGMDNRQQVLSGNNRYVQVSSAIYTKNMYR